ncbi:MAG TPA: hypothetical protein VGB75_14640 [Jatrophihabitans sp.]|uniref:hypothetical protein n=1 Tax=Jatrophihabitans sp. TaxID=1932789 RepID=UPI002F08C485
MGRANVYLPDDLERRVKAAQIPISEVCQRALLAAVEAAEGGSHPFGPQISQQFQRGWQAGLSWTRQASPEELLTLLRDQRLAEIPAELLPADQFSLTQEQALAWEAGFMEGARGAVRIPRPADTTGATGAAGAAEPAAGQPGQASGQAAASGDEPVEAAAEEPVTVSATPRPEVDELGDDSGCQIGVTLDGNRVSFDPHAAVRAGKSPVFAVLGQADERARLVLSVAQDAAARGTGVVLVDLSGQLTSRAAGLGKNVRVLRRSQTAAPRLEDLVQGAVGLGGLWDTVAGLSRGGGLAEMFTGSSDERIEPGYVTVIALSGDSLASALPAMQILGQLASKADFPRLLHVDVPSGFSVPAPFASRLGRIVRTARQQNAAVGLSAENADTIGQLASGGALLSTAIAFATSSPAEADRLRNLLGVDAPILVNPPGASVRHSDETWAVMRDLHGRLGQVRMEGW